MTKYLSILSDKRSWLVVGMVVLSFGLLSCEEDEDNKLAKAQQCLDGLNDGSAVAEAQACAEKVSGLSSPASYVIRCSVGFFVGNVRTTKIAQAFDAYEDAPENEKAQVLIGALAQNTTAQARITLDSCQKSEVPSLIYIATMSLTGSLIMDAGVGGTPGDMGASLINCATAPGTCDDAAIGAAVTAMADAYCIGDAANNQACVEISSAISNAGGTGDPAAIALALYALLQ